MKNLSLLIAAILALPVFYSCSGPTGEPQKDAEAFDDLINEVFEFDLECKKKKAKDHEYYIEHYDTKTYALHDSLISDIYKEYEHYEKRIADLNYQIQDKEDELQIKGEVSDVEETKVIGDE